MALMQPNPPSPQYDFILKEQKPQRGRFHLGLPGSGNNVSRGLLIGLTAIVLILFAIFIFGGNGSANKPLVDLVARAQEINRISTQVANQQDVTADTKNLVATVQSVLSSQQKQMASYLAGTGTKIDPAKQTSYENKSTDSQLTSADQAGNLASFYQSYLQTNLSNYQSALQTDYKTAPPKARTLIANDYASVTTILKSL